MNATPTIATVKELGLRYSNWGRWGEHDELGTLNHIKPEDVVAAAGLVHTGRIGCRSTTPAPSRAEVP